MYGSEDEEALENFKSVINVDVIYLVNMKAADKLPHNFQQCEHLCNYVLSLSEDFVSFRVKLLCMAFLIAVEEVIKISRHNCVDFSCLKVPRPEFLASKMYSVDIILFTSLHEG